MNRITLRTLASGLLVVFVLSGCTARTNDEQAKKPQDEQAKIVAEIETLGGKVQFDEKSPDRPVYSINLSETRITDYDLGNLKSVRQCKVLLLNGTQVTDAGLKHLKDCVQLRALFLGQTRVTDAGLEHLSSLTQLEALSLSYTQVTDAGLKHLKGLTSLRRLDLFNTKVTDAGVKELKQELPSVDTIH